MLTALRGHRETSFGSLEGGRGGVFVEGVPRVREILDAIKGSAGRRFADDGAYRTQGGAFVPSRAGHHLNPMANLAEREREVLDLLAQGLMYKEIADKLGIGFETVRTYVRRIYEKLQVRSADGGGG